MYFISQLTKLGAPTTSDSRVPLENLIPHAKTEMFRLLPQGHPKDAFLYGDLSGYTYLLSVMPPIPNSNWAVQTKPYNPLIPVKTQLHVFTCINPTYKVDGNDDYVVTKYLEDKRKEGVDIKTLHPKQVHQEALEQWFKYKEEQHGFRMLDLCPGKFTKAQFPHTDHKTGKVTKVTIVLTTVSGVLEVLDSERFRESLLHGIGRARRWGCGLLLVRK